ncbi:unnamed protein product [Durusdinium trenchii]|uniref:Uncharacterized protein n=1 Tax=Durusdinium trenchii TaxID=1381693 RepID=A0ABP0QED7_9DINO
MLGFHWSFIALLGFQTVPACSREVKLLPYLLGTAPRPAKWLALKNSNERKKFRQATCSFASIGFMSNLARLTFMMRNIVNSCPQSAIDTASYQPGEEATLPVKVCLLSTTALFAALAQLARSLTVLISTCERTATVDEGCAASIETLMVPAVLFINGGIAISAACDKGAIDLPKEIEPGRRLMNPLDLPVKRQWDIAQCTVDAIDATRSVAAIGLSMDAVARNCPVNYATPFTEELSRTACTVDVSVLLTSFTRLVFYLALAVNHCSPEPERDAICLVGVAAIAAGGTTTSAGAAGTHANETLPEEDAAAAAAADAAVNNAPFNIIRRLVKRRRLRSLNRSREMERIDEIWLKLGYNLSDANASWLKEDSNPEILEIQECGVISDRFAAGMGSWHAIEGAGWRNEVLGEPMTLEEDALACQARCSGRLGTVEAAIRTLVWEYHEMLVRAMVELGLCHLAPANATKLQPVLNFVGGPKVCEYEFKTQDGEFTQDGGDTQWPMLGQCTLVGFLAVLIISAVICQPHKEIFGFNFHRIGRMASPYAAAPIVPAVEEDA